MPLILVGLLTGLSLIIAIGPQNAYVLRQGIRREHVGVVVAICMISDAALIALGTAGLGALVGERPLVTELLRWGGAAYLLFFAARSLRSALRPGALEAADGAAQRASRREVARTAAALTFLNPHVYLDTLVLVGGIATSHGDGRWVFAAGAITASVCWFAGLGYGAHALSRPLARPVTWRVIDLLVAVVMVWVALRLILAT